MKEDIKSAWPLWFYIIVMTLLCFLTYCAGSKPVEAPKLIPKVRIVVYEDEIQAVIDSLQQEILKCEAAMDECRKTIFKDSEEKVFRGN